MPHCQRSCGALHLSPCRDLKPVLALKQLQHLTIWPTFAEQRQLLQLPQLPDLRVLHLRFTEVGAAAAAAPTWVLLPQLRGLQLHLWCKAAADRQHVPAILAAAAAASQLTSLQLSLAGELVQMQQMDPMPLCGSLVGLRGLRDFSLASASSLQAVCLVPGELVDLTAFTHLTRLVLSHVRDGAGELQATALLRSLKQLQHLDLQRCSIDLGSAAFLSAVGQLQQLTYLCLAGNRGLTAQGLMQLTGLSRLQQLRVDENQDVTGMELHSFWLGIHRHRSLYP